MQLHLLGLNHKTTPIEIRERVAITPEDLSRTLAVFTTQEKPFEIAILSTCNRTEIYCVTPSLDYSQQLTQNFLRQRFAHIKKYLYSYNDLKAVEHLMRVACGLDSMIVGEGQILGQVKKTWEVANSLELTGSVLNSAFNRAIACGKRSRTETKICRGAVSVGSAAAELAHKIFGDEKPRQILIVGAGKMGEVAVRRLQAQTTFVTNRTFERAEDLAHKIGGQAVPFESLEKNVLKLVIWL